MFCLFPALYIHSLPKKRYKSFFIKKIELKLLYFNYKRIFYLHYFFQKFTSLVTKRGLGFKMSNEFLDAFYQLKLHLLTKPFFV